MPGQRTEPRSTRALLRLRELIFSGEFAPGDRMSELPLVSGSAFRGRRCGSRSPSSSTRACCAALPGGGYVVREFTQADVRDAVELRGVLEGTAARFAAERGARRRELRALRAINETIAKLVHRADYESFERYVRPQRAASTPGC